MTQPVLNIPDKIAAINLILRKEKSKLQQLKDERERDVQCPVPATPDAELSKQRLSAIMDEQICLVESGIQSFEREKAEWLETLRETNSDLSTPRVTQTDQNIAQTACVEPLHNAKQARDAAILAIWPRRRKGNIDYRLICAQMDAQAIPALQDWLRTWIRSLDSEKFTDRVKQYIHDVIRPPRKKKTGRTSPTERTNLLKMSAARG